MSGQYFENLRRKSDCEPEKKKDRVAILELVTAK
jgi:hypothetical protein